MSEAEQNGLKLKLWLVFSEKKKMAYFVLQSAMQDGQYIACIAKEGEAGCYTTDWLWGADFALAEECAKKKNEQLGLSESEVQKIICSSMFAKEGE